MDEATQETAALDDDQQPEPDENALDVFDVPIDRGSDPANWPECVRRYLGTSDLAMHLYDHFRTRITPGADPRAEWERGRGAGFETGRRAQPRGIMLLDASSCSDAYRYVPDDVHRWRDPKHRAALTARARVFAAIVPGVLT